MRNFSRDYLDQILRYDPESGELFWRRRADWPHPTNQKYADQRAGCNWTRGDYSCRVVRVDGALVPAHRIIYCLVFGEWPVAEVDHIDGDALNNRPDNLRLASRSQQMQNTRARSPHGKGVTWDKSRQKFAAKIKMGGKVYNLGRFDRAEDAAQAYAAAAQDKFGAYSCVSR